MQSVIKELALRLASNCTSEAKRKISRLVFKSAPYVIFSRFEDILPIAFGDGMLTYWFFSALGTSFHGNTILLLHMKYNYSKGPISKSKNLTWFTIPSRYLVYLVES